MATRKNTIKPRAPRTGAASRIASAQRVQPRLALLWALMPYFKCGLSDADIALAARANKELRTLDGTRRFTANTVWRIRTRFAPYFEFLKLYDETGHNKANHEFYRRHVEPLLDGMKYTDWRFDHPVRETISGRTLSDNWSRQHAQRTEKGRRAGARRRTATGKV